MTRSRGIRLRARRGGRLPLRRSRAAFSLAEILIAIGILGIGLGMVATLFPAAVTENTKSVDGVIGTMICNNAIALGTAVFDTGDISGTAELDVLADAGHTAHLSAEDQTYPTGSNGGMGFVLLGRATDSDPQKNNAFQLVAVAYRKSPLKGNVTALQVGGTNTLIDDGTATKFTASSGGSNLRVGSPLIYKATGEYATIREVNGNEAILDRKVSTEAGNNAFVIVEAGVSGKSPAIAVMVTQTGLRPGS